mgnify:CR=1 FL=1
MLVGGKGPVIGINANNISGSKGARTYDLLSYNRYCLHYVLVYILCVFTLSCTEFDICRNHVHQKTYHVAFMHDSHLSIMHEGHLSIMHNTVSAI